jgi:hypothetical protein
VIKKGDRVCGSKNPIIIEIVSLNLRHIHKTKGILLKRYKKYTFLSFENYNPFFSKFLIPINKPCLLYNTCDKQ